MQRAGISGGVMHHSVLPIMPVELHQASAESLHHPEAHIPTCKAFLDTNSINHAMNLQFIHRSKIQALWGSIGGNATNIVKHASGRGILEQERSEERSCCQYPFQAWSYCVSNMSITKQKEHVKEKCYNDPL